MKKIIIAAMSLAALSATPTFAHTSVGIGLNLGGPVYAAPVPAYYPPPVAYYPPPPPPYAQAYYAPPPYYYGGYPYYGVRYRGYYR
jgi:hypothetical protein